MHAESEVFNFKGNSVNAIQIDETPYFIGNEIALLLGYKRKSDALKQHVDDDDKKILTYKAFGGIAQSLWQGNDYSNKTLINESGLYSLILNSNLPTAKEFKHWVTSELLPTIRKHGAYLSDTAIEKSLTNPDFIIGLATQLKNERKDRLLAEKEIGKLKPKANYYDQVLSNQSLMNITAIAKDYGYGAASFNKLLYKLKIQYPQSGTWFLYAKYQDKGWTQSKTYPYRNNHSATGNGSAIQTKWTQKGRLGLYRELKKYGILPMIEQKLEV